jgi:3-hydroxyisobutyrate dehydrogenase-like beta-hydroxyacid dehydrogenase
VNTEASAAGAPGAALRVGFVGVGHMGRPMVDRLVAAGVPVEVFARRVEVRAELHAAGIATVDSASELAGRCDVLIVCMFNDEQVRDALLAGHAIASMRAGSVLVSHVTGSPQLSVDLQTAAPAGVTVLDVPISGTEAHIRRGELTLLVGGDRDVLERIRPVLSTYSSPILHVGGLGDGQRLKLINNLLFAVNLRVALAAAALGESMGIAPAELSRVVAECSGGSFALDLLRHVAPQQIEAGARPYLVKDVGAIRAVAAAQGISLGDLGELANWVDE